MAKSENNTKLQEIELTHIIDASPQRAWEIYTDPMHVARWWGLKDTVTISCESDVRVGGIWRFVMRGADGQDYPFSGIFRDVVPYKLLVYTDGYGEAAQPRKESLVTVIFEELPGGKTKLTKTSVAPSDIHKAKAAWLKRAAAKTASVAK